jgi:hypothetical protein
MYILLQQAIHIYENNLKYFGLVLLQNYPFIQWLKHIVADISTSQKYSHL